MDGVVGLSTLKYSLIRTPLERPLSLLRSASRLAHTVLHPELAALPAEDFLIPKVVAKALSANSSAMDIGCHYGSLLSQIVSCAPNGHHHAVEAIPGKVSFLRKKFPEVKILQAALAEGPGETDFYINKARSGFSAMRPHGSEDESFERIRVPQTSLDEYSRRLARKIDFVKLDVEGAEELVLRGAKRFLAEHKPVVLFECGPSASKAFETTPAALHQQFDDYGYDVYFLADWLHDGVPTRREAFSQALEYPFRAFNWVAQPRA